MNRQPPQGDISTRWDPRLFISNPRIKGSYVENTAGGTDWAFEFVYQVYDAHKFNSGFLYGIPKHYNGDVAITIYKSVDNGLSWTSMGTVPCDVTAGERIKYLFVVPENENIIILKYTAVSTVRNVLTYDKDLTLLGTLDIGASTWHSPYQNIDARGNCVCMAEYTNSLEAGTCKVWTSTNYGQTWSNRTANVPDNTCRHFHCVQSDPFVASTFWLSSGDNDEHCKIWKSSDYGYSWTYMGGGSQEFRTLNFVFTGHDDKRVYWGMDNPAAEIPCKIFASSKDDLSGKEIIGYTFDNLPVYALTRTIFPNGFLIWLDHEPSSKHNDHIPVQFYDFRLKTIKTVAEIPVFYIDRNGYYGFNSAAKYQCPVTGHITAEIAAVMDLHFYDLGREYVPILFCKLSY